MILGRRSTATTPQFHRRGIWRRTKCQHRASRCWRTVRGIIMSGTDEFIEVLKLPVIAAIDDRLPARGNNHRGGLMLRPPQRRTLDGHRSGVIGVDLDHPAKPWRRSRGEPSIHSGRRNRARSFTNCATARWPASATYRIRPTSGRSMPHRFLSCSSPKQSAWTGDDSLYRELLPNVRRALDWIEEPGRPRR